LSLTPVFAAFATWRIGRAAGMDAAGPEAFGKGRRLGMAAALLAFAMLEGPALWTRVNLTGAMADSGSAAVAISRLRAWHSERALLKACYEGNRATTMSTDVSGWIMNGWRIPAMMFDGRVMTTFDSEKARDVFFRVTGKPFNSLKPPVSRRGNAMRGLADPMEGMEFDDHVGGDEVAVRLKSLDLAESRFDGHVDGVSGIAYGEWTMVFRNASSNAQEARCQVRLPRGGRVSRLTLWVNGEPREAAFSTVAKVKAAYKAVAVVQRRDPVLVNVVGPDTVMVQCFPVPAHGEMKIRFGVTAPLDKGRWEMPRIVERNFGTVSTLGHAVWLQGDLGFKLTGTGKALASHRDGEGYSLPAALGGNTVMDSGLTLENDPLPTEPAVVWCEDRFAKAGERFLIREPVTLARPGSEKVVVVIDGSSSLAASKDWIIRALAAAAGEELSIILADDGARRVSLPELKSYRFSGGRDNEPALREAILLAKETGAPVVWLHGPQAVGLSQSEAIQQLLERGTTKPIIHEMEAVPGPNRLAEAIYRSGCLRRGPALIDPVGDLADFLKDLRMERRESSWNWKRAASSDGLAGRKVWDQLARSWAAAAVEDPAVIMADGARAELAARYQLVTPFSGAVVLETQQQYKDHGLKPVDGDATPSIPTVPEPSAGILVMLAAAAALMRRKRQD
jgi:Vault protein inter-alpha-trypsin domain